LGIVEMLMGGGGFAQPPRPAETGILLDTWTVLDGLADRSSLPMLESLLVVGEVDASAN
jgi:hypothetical protein